MHALILYSLSASSPSTFSISSTSEERISSASDTPSSSNNSSSISCSGSDSIVLATAFGQGIRFKEREVRLMGRQAAGVRGVRLAAGDCVVGMQAVSDDRTLVFATEYGYGKRVRVNDFRVAHRGGSGVRTIPTNERNGKVVGLGIVDDEADMLLIDQQGKIIRLPSSEVRTMGRQAQGVRLIRLDEGQKLVRLAVVSCCEQADAQERKLHAPEQEIEEELLEDEGVSDAEDILSSEVEEIENVEGDEADNE